jgi:hypothetical protein
MAGKPATSTAGPSWRDVWSALPDFFLAVQFLLMWIDPNIIGARFLPLYVGLMVAEFIVIHSSVFLGNVAYGSGDKKAKLIMILGLAGFYSLFFLGICLAIGEWYYMFGFWLLIGNRLLGVALGQAPEGEEKLLLQRGWAANTILYLFGVFLTILLPLPQLGITSEIQSQFSLPGEGEWVDNPHTTIAFGFFYYTMVGWSELLGHRWFANTKVRS